jgi:hypothetical protein
LLVRFGYSWLALITGFYVDWETKVRVIFYILFAAVMAGCSNQAAYENIQINKRNACLELPPSQYDECMAEANTSYNDYKNAREEAIGE